MPQNKQRSNSDATDCRIACRRFESRPALLFVACPPGQQIGIRTADLRDHGWLHYHSVTVCCAAVVLPTAWS